MSVERRHSKEFMQKFGARLRELRKKRNFTIDEARKALNVPRSTYASWELGNRIPLNKPLQDIAELFETHESYLMLTSDSIEPPNPSPDLNNVLSSVKSITYKDKELTKEQIETITILLENWINKEDTDKETQS